MCVILYDCQGPDSLEDGLRTSVLDRRSICQYLTAIKQNTEDLCLVIRVYHRTYISLSNF